MKRSAEEVSTHVLIPTDIADKLKELSKRTRITQSEFLREAVLDLLSKYEDGTLGMAEEHPSHE